MRTSVCLAAFLSVLNGSAVAALHPPILVESNSDFVAANGVTNVGAAGSESDPFVIDGWEIDASISRSCITLRNTTAHVVLQNNTCLNARAGIVLEHASNAVIAHNSVSHVRGDSQPEIGMQSHGILVSEGNNIVVMDNGIRDVRGGAATPAYGIVLRQTSNATVTRNTIAQLYGGPGISGAAGASARADGAEGGRGGDAIAILIEASGRFSNASVSGNVIGPAYAGAGGRGGDGAFGGGRGAVGGAGGAAHGVQIYGLRGVSCTFNEVHDLYAGIGGGGGLGGFGGGAGGNGGRGGDAIAINLDSVQAFSCDGNSAYAIYGNDGANGGFGGFGGVGGNGGDGGAAVGLRLHEAQDGQRDNRIASLAGGTGGLGVPPDGIAGRRGATHALQSE